MALVVRNTKELGDGKNLKAKILLVSMPGFGKTSFLGTVPDILIGACEEGNGNGLASIVQTKQDYVELENYPDFDLFCSGQEPTKKYSALGLDSLSTMTKTFIKDYALTFPRTRGETLRRKAGVPELDDYLSMGELTRKLVNKLLHTDKHIVATATLKINKPDEETGNGEYLLVPDLPGQLALGVSAMFDIILVGRTKSMLRDPKDAKSRYVQRYWLTQAGMGAMAKCRYNEDFGRNVLAPEEPFDLKTGQGTFPYLLNKITAAYTAVPAKAA